MANSGEITKLLQQGDAKAFEKLLPIVYNELRQLAGALFRGEFRFNHTLQPTALVHEAYLKLIGDSGKISWQNRAHFFGIAARSMRQILVNYAVARKAEKRGGGQTILALDNVVSFFNTQNIEILELHEALEKLAQMDEKQAEIVELKFFGGLTNEETAEVLKISRSTVKREWEMARSWLYRELKK
ncbi:MAG: sigma-70 family RNA polymerase sigma factor [Pyrinomonadaceae bacterium]|nr:sigma-70 family RNA polymerase sigma factor [Pyrinomonadaceae bacterium]